MPDKPLEDAYRHSKMWTATEWIAFTSVVVAGLAIVGNIVRDKWRFIHEDEMQRQRFIHERAAKDRQQCYEKIAKIEQDLSINMPLSDGRSGITGFKRFDEQLVEKLFSKGGRIAQKDPEAFHNIAYSSELMLDGLRSRLENAVPAARWIERIGWTPEIREKAMEVQQACLDLEKAVFATLQSFKVAHDQLIRSEEEHQGDNDEPVVLFAWDGMSFDLSENWREFVETRRLAYERVRELASVIRES